MRNHKSNSTKLDLNKKAKVNGNFNKKAKVVQNYSNKKNPQLRICDYYYYYYYI